MADKLQLMLEAERRGILPPEQKVLLDEARKRGLIDQSGNFAEALFAAPPEPKGSITGVDFGRASAIEGRPGSWRAGLAYALGNDEDVAREYTKVIPGSSIVRNEAGRPMVRLESGDTYEVNPEGFDVSDVLRFVAKAASFFPAARAVSGIGNLGVRATAGAGLSAATEAGTQKAVGREQIDPVEVAAAGAGGGASELFVAPVVQALFRDTAKLPRAEAVRRAQMVLAQRAEGMPEDAVVQIGQRLREIELGGSPDDLIGEAEFGFQYTRGQRTGDTRQLMREERLSQTPLMLDVQRQNADTANRAVRDIARQVAGGEVDSAPGAVARATERVRAEHQALKGQVDEAYGRFRETEAAVPPDYAARFPQRLQERLADTNIDPVNTPGAVRALQIAEDVFANPEGALSAKRIDQVRRQLRTIGGKDPSDKRAVRLIINEMDGWLDDAVEQGLVSGDPKAIEFLKEARRLNTDLARRFGDSGMGKDVDRIVGRMLQRNASPEELARMIYGAGQVSAPTATRALQRIRHAMAGKSTEWDQLRAQVLRAAVTGKGDNALGIQAIHNNLKELLVNRPELMKTLFNPGELQTVQRLTAAMEPLMRSVDKRSSGTTERLMRVAAPYITRFPILRQVFDYGSEAAQTAAARRSLMPLMPPRGAATPAAGAAAGAFYTAPWASPNRPNNP